MGNRYGYLYVPLSIDEEEFNTILKVAEEENLPHLDLLEKWFQLDHNAVPPKFVYVVSFRSVDFLRSRIFVASFQPVTMYFKHFEEDLEEKKQWAAEEKIFLKALRDAVDLAFAKTKSAAAQPEKYFQSSKFDFEVLRRTSRVF